MKSSIITQDGDIINYDHVIRIAIFTVSNVEEDTAEAAELGIEPASIYLIEAETDFEPMDDEADNSFTLAAYDDREKAENAMEQIIKWLEKGMESVFRMPK